jgi:hypothetical protein
MKSHGTLVCSRCLQEFDVSGEVEMGLDADGALVSMLVPDIASTAILQAHKCEPLP